MRLDALLAAALLALAAPAFADDGEAAKARPALGSSELVEGAKRYDGAEVAFEGEAIGDPMARGGGTWVNLSDGTYAIGVWMPTGTMPPIRRYGSYAWAGDRVRVAGVFHRACPEHGGDLDIHAESAEAIAGGTPRRHAASPSRAAAAAALLALAAALLVLWRKRPEPRPGEGGSRRARH